MTRSDVNYELIPVLERVAEYFIRIRNLSLWYI